MRMRRTIGAALALLFLAACSATPGAPQKQEKVFFQLFDTVVRVVGYVQSEAQFEADAAFIQEELRTYHQLYDIYHTYEGIHNLKTVNDQAGVAPVEVDGRIIDLLLEAREMYDRTGGRVNVAMGSVLSLWHDCRQAAEETPENAAIPPMDALQEAAKHTDIEDMVIDEAASTVYLADPEMRLDVGAIAKGFAAQRVMEACRERGIESLLINVGGNVCALGSQDGAGKPWVVAIQAPSEEETVLDTSQYTQEDYLAVVGAVDQSLVTSGTYQRYYEVDGVRYHHIIDPATRMPSQYFTSVTVMAEDSGVADALATALFNMSYEEGAAILEEMEGVEAYWLEPDGTEHQTGGFQAARIAAQTH